MSGRGTGQALRIAMWVLIVVAVPAYGAEPTLGLAGAALCQGRPPAGRNKRALILAGGSGPA
jgi:hypothetical protein